jgi:hypothetical protein
MDYPQDTEAGEQTEKELKAYYRAARKIFNTASGHRVLKMWKIKDLEGTALCPNDPMSTGYMLGRKEFVQECINHLKDDLVLDDVKIVTE